MHATAGIAGHTLGHPLHTPLHATADIAGHTLGHLPNALDVSPLHSKFTFDVLPGLDQLEFGRCNWADVECARLSATLPLCTGLQRLILPRNNIANAGVSIVGIQRS